MALSLSVVKNIAALEALGSAWAALLARSAVDEPMASPLWLLAWWRTFGPLSGRRLIALAFEEEGRLVGLVPLLLRTHSYGRAIPFRRIELLGTGEPEEDEICSEYLGVIAERGAEARVIEAFGRALTSGALGAWDELVFSSMDGSSPLPLLLSAELSRRGFQTETWTSSMSPFIPLPKAWPEYLAELSSSSRYLVKRALRDFEQWAGHRAELHVANDARELSLGRRTLETLHDERWRGHGVFASARFSAFHAAVMPELLSQGALELLWLTVGGTAVASVYNIVWRNKVYFYQSGRSLDLPKSIRVGIVLHAYAIQRAIQAGRCEYDFLGGLSQYKSKLALRTRPLVGLRAVRQQRGWREQLLKIAIKGTTQRPSLQPANSASGEDGGEARPHMGAAMCGAVGFGDSGGRATHNALIEAVPSDPQSSSFASRLVAFARRLQWRGI